MSFLPSSDRRYLADRSLSYREAVDGPNKGIILEAFPLPTRRFDAERADVLIMLPANYPDAPPDMFYLIPWVRLAISRGYPSRADVPVQFGGQNWQRWSRHNNEWRPGLDGIWTMVKRVEHALEIAA